MEIVYCWISSYTIENQLIETQKESIETTVITMQRINNQFKQSINQLNCFLVKNPPGNSNQLNWKTTNLKFLDSYKITIN